MTELVNTRHSVITAIVIILVGVALYLSSLVNYLLFHSLAEIFSIVVAAGLFMVAWNARDYLDNGYLKFLGVAYLFIAFIDLLHTLSYKGMSIFTDYDFYANQLWIAARFLESITLVVAFAFLKRGAKLRETWLALAYLCVTAVAVASIFIWKIFPVCFVAGEGQTTFKIVSEYVISSILIIAIIATIRNRDAFSPRVYRRVIAAILCTIGSELAFTFYIDNYGLSNLIGHYLKIASFGFVYDAIVRTGIVRPYRLIFRELDAKNHQLEAALEDIHTLKGIIPICASCKKIRDDEGYWNRLEEYIHEHSGVEFSHGICPECAERLYPDETSDSDEKKDA